MTTLSYLRLLSITLILGCFSLIATAEVVLPQLISDGMVLQRDKEVRIWGWADPGETVTLDFQGEQHQTTADARGNFYFTLGPYPAGGPYTLTITGADNTISLSEVYVGEVWLCSGQSNMEWPLYRSGDAEEEIATADEPQLRLFQVARKMSTAPLEDVASVGWQACTPESVADFSAVAYHFGKALYQRYQVPIGLIQSDWGGTKIQTWMSGTLLNELNMYSEQRADLAELNIDSLVVADERAYEVWKADFANLDRSQQGNEFPWVQPTVSTDDWEDVTVPRFWEHAGHEGLDGIVYLRTQFTLENVPSQAATLHLGPIYSADQTFVNGQKVGEMPSEEQKLDDRHYTVPASLLQKGRNVLVVRVENYRGTGGLYGKPDELYLELTNQDSVPLAGTWKMKVANDSLPPRPGVFGPNHRPTLLYNGMIHPLTTYTLQGVIWYQGESNRGRPEEYRTLFSLMIRDWRARWEDDFPFLYVQIAPYGPAEDKPVESKLAELRDAQLATLDVPNTGMVVTLDIGDSYDIHPDNKRDVGYRLALAARKLAYEEDIVYSGAIAQQAVIQDGKVIVSFAHTAEGLKTLDGEAPRGFELAGEDGKFYQASATIAPRTPTITVEHEAITDPWFVRYAWADNPEQANLANTANLPASPFSLFVQKAERPILPRLQVDETGHYLVKENGESFFWLGDTAWKLFQHLTKEQARRYLLDRQQKKFTVIQAVLTGLRADQPNVYGELAFSDQDFSQPNEAYWAHVDTVIAQGTDLGLYWALLPVWARTHIETERGDPEDKVLSTAADTTAAYQYGYFVGNRYRDYKNIIWVLGGDTWGHIDFIYRAMARGLTDGYANGDPNQILMTFHPKGGTYRPPATSSGEFYHDEPWLDFNMIQSGHRVGNRNYQRVSEDYQRTPTKPTLDAEPCYEQHPVKHRYENGAFQAWHLRRRAYWSLLAGAFGFTYGGNGIWQMSYPGNPGRSTHFSDYWYNAIDYAGASDMTHVRALMESFPFINPERVPDQSIVRTPADSVDFHVQAARAKDYRYWLVYFTNGSPTTLDLTSSGEHTYQAWWFNPRDGKTYDESGQVSQRSFATIEAGKVQDFNPPGEAGPDNDWVLILDATKRDAPVLGNK